MIITRKICDCCGITTPRLYRVDIEVPVLNGIVTYDLCSVCADSLYKSYQKRQHIIEESTADSTDCSWK